MEVLGTLTKGGMALFGKDMIKMMQMLVDIEMNIFKDLNVKAVFHQNIIADLILGFEVKEILAEYCYYIKKNIMPFRDCLHKICPIF